jgi:Na+-driven multidrug efflux pump
MVMMNIAIILYVSGSGLASVIPSIIGQQIGKGNLEGAKKYLSVIRYSSTILFLFICLFIHLYHV